MATYGGASPYPKRFGGGKTKARLFQEILNADRGDGYSTESTSTVYAENLAIARAIAAAWSTNARLSHLWDSLRMPSDILARWEKVLALAPAATDTLQRRRAAVGTKLAQFGLPSISGYLTAGLTTLLGSAFVAIEFISYANANIQVPDGTYPWGAVGDSPWSSTVSNILVRLTKPTGWTENDFYNVAALVNPYLDSALPAYVTFSWYRAGAVSTPVTGGPSGGGFYLDETNLDNEAFAS